MLEKNLATFNKPKELISLYFVCKAMDGYSVVFSYNELFNSPTASVLILKNYDSFDLKNMPEKPLILMMSGAGVGRLGMRGLKSIEIKKVE